MLFSELDLHPNLLRGISEAGYTVCTSVQEQTLAHALAGKDIMAQSQTGSGKTAAFLIPLLHMMTEKAGSAEQALIIAPTRELASQVEAEALLLAVHLQCTVASIYGGVGYGRQEESLRNGVDIVVATPGRLIDLTQRGAINLHNVAYLVIDEADRLFDMGFLQDLRKILQRMRPASQRQTMLFSATLSYAARRLATDYMNNPMEIEIASKGMTVDTVNQQLYHVGNSEKPSLLVGLLRKEAPSNCMIFVNYKNTAERLSCLLTANGFPCEYLTGDLPQNRRQRTVDRFKEGEIPFLVATDVAARGIHVDDLSLVVNFDLPENSEIYVHRIGRTARAGKQGKAISIACENTVEALPAIEKLIGMRIPVIHPEEELFVRDLQSGRHLVRQRTSGGRTSERRHGGPQRGPRREHSSHEPSGQQKREYGNRSTRHGRSQDRYADVNRPSRQRRSRQDVDGRSSPSSQGTQQTGHSSHKPRSADKPRSLFRRIAGLFRR